MYLSQTLKQFKFLLKERFTEREMTIHWDRPWTQHKMRKCNFPWLSVSSSLRQTKNQTQQIKFYFCHEFRFVLSEEASNSKNNSRKIDFFSVPILILHLNFSWNWFVWYLLQENDLDFLWAMWHWHWISARQFRKFGFFGTKKIIQFHLIEILISVFNRSGTCRLLKEKKQTQGFQKHHDLKNIAHHHYNHCKFFKFKHPPLTHFFPSIQRKIKIHSYLFFFDLMYWWEVKLLHFENF